MNQFFNTKRFCLLLKKDFQENSKQYILTFFTFFGVFALFLIWNSWSEYDSSHYDVQRLNQDQLTIFSFLFAGIGLGFAAKAMDIMNNKTKRIAYLSLPASNFEKFFSRWLIVTIGYILVFFTALWLADLLRVLICAIRFPYVEVRMLDFSKLIDTEQMWASHYVFPHKIPFFLALSTYFLFHSILILGTLFWMKNSFIKTFSIVAVLTTLFILICRWAVIIFYVDSTEFGNVINSFLPLHRENPENIIFSVIILLLSCFALFNWILAYFRFKESEIIKRW